MHHRLLKPYVAVAHPDRDRLLSLAHVFAAFDVVVVTFSHCILPRKRLHRPNFIKLWEVSQGRVLTIAATWSVLVLAYEAANSNL